MKRLIMTDSTADLPASIIEYYNIKVLPVRVVLNGKAFLDREEISARQFYDHYHKFETMVTQPTSYEDYALTFMQLVRQYDELIIVHCSAHLSETYLIAKKVVEGLQGRHRCRVALVDSKLCGMALGLVIIAAARASKGGDRFDEVVNRIERTIPQIVSYIAIPTLKYLRKNQKITGLRAMLGLALKVKPILHLEDGRLAVKSKLMGEQKNMILSLIDQIKSDVAGHPISLAISHTKDVSFVENLREVFDTAFDCRDIYVTYFGPSIGINTGPETTGVAFLRHSQ